MARCGPAARSLNYLRLSLRPISRAGAPTNALYDLAKYTLGHEERLGDIVAGYGTVVTMGENRSFEHMLGSLSGRSSEAAAPPRTVCGLPARSPSLRRRALITTSTTLLPPLQS
jgi:hypothetical protein